MEYSYKELDVVNINDIPDVESRIDYSADTHKLMTINKRVLQPLRHYWSDMPLDQYLAEGYRQRCLTRFQYRSGKLYPLKSSSVYQSRENNKVFGDLPRQFSDLNSEMIIHKSFLGLIKLFVNNLPKLSNNQVLWVHQIRINVSPSLQGRPVPEGIHRDERLYVAIIIVDKQGIEGEMTQLFKSREEEPFWQKTIGVNQMLMFNDQRLYHNTTDFLTVDSDGGYRDIFILALSDVDKGVV